MDCDMPDIPTMKSLKSGSESAAEKPDFSKVAIEPLFKDYVDFETFSKSDFRAVKVLECEAVPKSKKLLKFVLDDGTGENRVIFSGIHAWEIVPQFIQVEAHPYFAQDELRRDLRQQERGSYPGQHEYSGFHPYR